jgi:APA family basic amino acid/polyamine antiporter
MTAATALASAERLKANTIGPWGLAALAIGITSPAMGLYGLWGPMQSAAGPITPLIFLAAMLMTLPTAISYAELNRKAPSAAAASAWVWAAVNPSAGYGAGLLMATYFLMAAIAQPLMFALFFHDLLEQLHVTLPQALTLTLGVLIASLPVAWVCLRGTESSIKSTVLLMVLETVVVLALSITIVVQQSSQPGAITLAPLDPHHASSLSGFWVGMILGVLAFCGFDVVSTAAEESHAPREHLPKAILLTVIGIAIFWALNGWAFTLSITDEEVRRYTASGLTPVTPMAQAYWGWGNLIVILTAFTGLTAVYISSMQGTSRIVFALARHRLLPQALGRLAGEKRVPRNAVVSVLVAVLALDLGTLYVLDNGLDSFTWWANALVFFATLTFLAVNVANTLLFWRRARGEFRVVKNLVVPMMGVLLNGYLIYAAFLSALWAGSWRTGKSIVIACVALLALQVCTVACIRLFKPRLLRQGPPRGVESPTVNAATHRIDTSRASLADARTL